MATASLQQTVSADIRKRQREVRSTLRRIRAGVWSRIALRGASWILCTLTACFVITLVVDWWLRLSLPFRLVLDLVVIGFTGWVVWTRLATPLLSRLGLMDIAVLADRRVSGTAERVANVLQLPDLVNQKITVSPAMIESTVARDIEELRGLKSSQLFDEWKPQWHVVLAVCAIALPVMSTLVAPDLMRLWCDRWCLGKDVRWPQSTYLSVVGLEDDGTLLVPRGEVCVIRVSSDSEPIWTTGGWSISGRGKTLFVNDPVRPTSQSPSKVQVRYSNPTDGTLRDNFTKLDDHRFRFELPSVLETTELSISGGDDWIEPFEVVPIDRPVMESLVIRATWPAHRGARVDELDGLESELLFLLNTVLELEVKSSAPLHAAQLVANIGVAPELERVSDTTFRTRWTMSQSQVLEIQMTAEQGGIQSRPQFISVVLLEDQSPRVTVRSSGVRRRVTPVVRIPLTVSAKDDFMLESINLETQALVPDQERVGETTIDIDKPTNVTVEFDAKSDLRVTELSLIPGTILKIRGHAADDCAESVQHSHSRWLSFQVVTSDELFYEILMRQRSLRARFQEAVKIADDQVRGLETLVDREQLVAAQRRHQVTTRHVWNVSNRLSESLIEMELNQLGTQQALDQLRIRVIEPLQSLHSDDLASMTGMLGGMASSDEAMTDGLSDAQTLQGTIVETMKRVLQQMAQWESFVDIINQLRDISEMQESVLQSTQKLKKDKVKDIFDQ